MSDDAEATNPGSGTVRINPAVFLPGAALALGYAILCVLVLGDWGLTAGLITLALGAAFLIGSSCTIPATPALLVVANGLVALILLLQGLGVCTAGCGGFIDYQSLAGMPTALVGCGLHVVLIAMGVLLAKGRWVTGQVYRVALALGQGASAFFAAIMISHGHWCPSCAASHVIMAGQVLLLWRLTPNGRLRLVHAGLIALIALAVNASFHHRFERAEQAPGDALLGYLATVDQAGILVPAGEDGPVVRRVVAPPAVAPRAAKGERPAIVVDLSDVNTIPERALPRLGPPVQDSAPAEEPATATPVAATLRESGFYRWGSASAPIIMRTHMSLACGACQAHWPHLRNLAPLVRNGQVSVEFLFSWPLSPRVHCGARLATYVIYTAGLQGEPELLAVADWLFSADGVRLISKIDSVLGAENGGAEPTTESQREALTTLFVRANNIIDAKTAVTTYANERTRIDQYLAKSVRWVIEKGQSRDTPRTFYLRNGEETPYLDSTSFDRDVVEAYIHRGSEPHTNP
ncbi:MAG: hypothetical protein PF961_10530 [Planctomycetota bacterium]|jgi:hypothetical protein|nr:hypothetical protein [Planctomycetota bacterium]